MGAKGGCEAKSTKSTNPSKTSFKCSFRVKGDNLFADVSWMISNRRDGTQHKVIMVPYRSKSFTCNNKALFTVDAFRKQKRFDTTIQCEAYVDGKLQDSDKATGKSPHTHCKVDLSKVGGIPA
jgi:hypothetical protein